jgi:predicted nucleic acid-binding protein
VANYVLDANVVVAIVGLEKTRNQLVDEFWRELTTADLLIGPQLLIPECASAIRTMVFDKFISEDIAIRWMRLALRLPITINQDDRQFFRAIELAGGGLQRKADDMQYLATAELTESTLVTLDSGLRQRAIDIKHPVRFLR